MTSGSRIRTPSFPLTRTHYFLIILIAILVLVHLIRHQNNKLLQRLPPKPTYLSRTFDTAHIVLCFDDADYNLGMKATINSLLYNTNYLHRIFLHFIIDEEDLKSGTEFVEKLQLTFPSAKFDYGVWKEWKDVQDLYPEHHFKKSLNIARIYLYRLFPNVEKILSLDTDLLLTGDVLELWDRSDVRNHPIASFPSDSPLNEYVKPTHIIFKNKTVQNVPDMEWIKRVDLMENVFSCGFFVANLTQWKKLDSIGRIEWLLGVHKEKSLLRRALKKALMNLAFNKQYYHLPEEWEGDNCSRSGLDDVGEARMLHFSGFLSKPWDSNAICSSYVRRLWYNYFSWKLY